MSETGLLAAIRDAVDDAEHNAGIEVAKRDNYRVHSDGWRKHDARKEAELARAALLRELRERLEAFKESRGKHQPELDAARTRLTYWFGENL